jgi:hypothetical protein
MVEEQQKYAAAVSLIGTSEATSVSRFNTFRVFSAILSAGWVQLATRTDTVGGKLAMSVFCLLGIAAGVVWAGIGGRSRSYVEMYRKVAEKLESKEGQPLDASDSPCTAAKQFTSAAVSTKRRWMEQNAGASMLFFVAPLAVALLFVVLLALTWTCRLVPAG